MISRTPNNHALALCFRVTRFFGQILVVIGLTALCGNEQWF